MGLSVNPDKERFDRLVRDMSQSGNLTYTTRVLARWGHEAKKQWVHMVQSMHKKYSQPGWWARGYLGPSGSNIQWSFTENPLEIRIFHSNGGAKYDFQKVIHEGREPYNLKNIVATSAKSRISKGGVRYLVIPMKAEGGSPDFTMQKIGEFREQSSGGSVLRNRYSYNRVRRGNLAEFQQVQRGGSIRRTYANLVTLSENSDWNPYPKIGGFKYAEFIEEMIKSGRATISIEGRKVNFKQSISFALAMDLDNYMARRK